MFDQCKLVNFMLGIEIVFFVIDFFFGMKNGWEGDQDGDSFVRYQFFIFVKYCQLIGG